MTTCYNITMDKKRINYKKIILTVVATTALLSVAMIAPNALQILKIFDKRKQQQQRYVIKRKLNLLIEQGFLKFEKTSGGKQYLSITTKGRMEFLKHQRVIFKKPRVWDKTWRVVIFDIPENKKRPRDIVRFHLKRIGFIQLQKSVWVFPYDCEEMVLLLKTNFKFGKEVLYMKVNSIENDRTVRNHFNLKS